MARQLSGMRGVKKQALVVSLDDDEYLALSEPTATLQTLRSELLAKRVCALTLPWRVFGSSGHRCQPSGPLLRRFVHRSRTEHELRGKEATQGAAKAEARRRHLNTPYGGKPIYLFLEETTPQCGTHCKQRAGRSNPPGLEPYRGWNPIRSWRRRRVHLH